MNLGEKVILITLTSKTLNYQFNICRKMLLICNIPMRIISVNVPTK